MRILSGAGLSGAGLGGAGLSGAGLSGAGLSGAGLSGAGLRACLVFFALTASFASCTHVEVALPGVLDLRSDAGELALDRRPSSPVEVEREGMDATFGGAGVSAAGPNVSVEGRVWWLASLVRLADGDVDEGLRTLLGARGARSAPASEPRALRDVVVTEEISGAESVAFFCTLPVPCAAAFLPSRTVRWSATRVVVPVEAAPADVAP